MNKIKTFVRTFTKSLTSPKYYKDILKAKFSFSLKYLILLLIIVNLIFSVRFVVKAFRALPGIEPFISKSKIVLTNLYPEKLVITVKKQKITTNVKEPYFIDFPKELSFADIPYKHLIVFDTKGTVEKYSKHESVVMVMADSLVVPEGKDGYKVVSLKDKLSEVPEGQKFDRKLWDQGMKMVSPYFDRAPHAIKNVVIVVAVLYPIVGTLFVLLGKMFGLIFFTLISLLVCLIFRKKIGFGKLYQLGMHVSTMPIVITLILSLIGISIPFVYFFIFLIWMGIVVARLKA